MEGWSGNLAIRGANLDGGTVENLTFQEVLLFTYLIEILTFIARQHIYRSKYFVLTESLAIRVARLLDASQKHLKLSTSLALQPFNRSITLLLFTRFC